MQAGRVMSRAACRLFVWIVSCAVTVLGAVDADGVDRHAPDFVHVSLVVAAPGDDLMSAVGHVCLRLECPTFKLDNCFSCEHEKASAPFLSVFFERLRMGLFAFPTDQFLKSYREEGRRVVAYPLDLPPDMKLRLWRHLDETVAKGAEGRYDYVRRACTVAVLEQLRATVAPHMFAFPPWPPSYARTRREIFHDAIGQIPWSRAFLHMAVGTAFDSTESEFEKVILPADLVALLAETAIDGRPVLNLVAARELLPQRAPRPKGAPLTPLVAASTLLCAAVGNAFCPRLWKGVGVLFGAILSVLAALLVYFYAVSDLPTTNWNWLLVPFNPLFVLGWRWRRKWGLAAGVLLVLWSVGMCVAPHRLTDLSFVVLSLAFAVFYASQRERKPV